MGHARICESEREYRALERSGSIKYAVGAYAIGRRGSDILDTLARVKVWADNIGQYVPCPVGFDRPTWDDILSALVVQRLGNRRCLDCGEFFTDESRTRCFIVRSNNVPMAVPFCPQCGSVTSDVIGCTVGVA